jgi:hypothetical protein
MTVYEEFVATHYVDRTFRSPVQVQAVIHAAGLKPQQVTEDFWKEVRPEWLWGMSPVPFAGRNARRRNAEYKRFCELQGARP